MSRLTRIRKWAFNISHRPSHLEIAHKRLVYTECASITDADALVAADRKLMIMQAHLPCFNVLLSNKSRKWCKRSIHVALAASRTGSASVLGD